MKWPATWSAQKEITTLRGKMKVLVDKIEEYRSSEEDMHRALVSAQKTARTIEEESKARAEATLTEAQERADAILADARAQAESILAAARAQEAEIVGTLPTLRQAEERRFETAQKTAAEYIQSTTRKLAETLKYLSALQDADLTGVVVTPAPDERRAISAPAEEAPAEPAAEEPVAEEPAPAEEAAPVPAEDDIPDYFRDFENAVFSARQDDTPAEAPAADEDDAIADAADDDSPVFRF